MPTTNNPRTWAFSKNWPHPPDWGEQIWEHPRRRRLSNVVYFTLQEDLFHLIDHWSDYERQTFFRRHCDDMDSFAHVEIYGVPLQGDPVLVWRTFEDFEIYSMTQMNYTARIKYERIKKE